MNVLQSLFFSERPLHEGLEKFISKAGMDSRDTAFARAIVMTVLRRLGEIDGILKNFLHQALPVRSGPAELILRMATAELVFMDVPAHATVENQSGSGHVRPHDIEIVREANGEKLLPAKVEHLQAVGPVVRVELRRDETNETVEAELRPDVYRALNLQIGDQVFIRPRNVRIYVEDYAI